MPKERSLVDTLKIQGAILLSFVGVFWVIELVDLVLGGALDGAGIRPRTLDGLVGIPIAPFLHGGFLHLAANTLPFVVLGWLVMLRDVREFFLALAFSAVVGGLGTWLVGAPGSVHIGASGLVFGLFGYLISIGFFERKLGSLLLSMAVAILYGGMIWGVLPSEAVKGISWETHLFGGAGGILAAYLIARRARRRALAEAAR